ncbi:MAG: class I SAM-dependent methyltransferase [Bacteroidia bacterium]
MKQTVVWDPQAFKDHFENSVKNNIILSALEKRKLEFYIKELKLQATDVLLDAGCGYGRLSKSLINSVSKIIGIDINPDNINYSIKYVGKNFEGQVVDLSTGKLPYPDNSIDKIVFDNVLMFFNKELQYKLLNESKRVLKQNGVIAFNFENANYFLRGLERFFTSLYKLKAKLKGKQTPFHNKYTLSFYEDTLKNLGFSNIRSIGGTFYHRMGIGPIEVLPKFLRSFIAKKDAKHFNGPEKVKMFGITLAASIERF